MNKKDALFILSVIFILVLAFFLIYPDKIINSRDNKNLNDHIQITTTTNQDETIPNKQTESTIYENKNHKPLLLYPNSFGPLKNVYKDKEFGFSLNYPEELKISAPDCISLNDKYSDGTFAIKICNQNSPLSLYNPNFNSLDEYKNDYILKTNKEKETLRVLIRKSEEIITSKGVKGLKQVIDVEFFNPITGTSTVEMLDFFWHNQTRYVFYNPQKGVIELLIFRGIPDLKEAIIQSISF